MLRLGSIQFINSLPVDFAIQKGFVSLEAQMTQGTPAELNQKIIEKELDISPISAFWYAKNQDEFLLLPNLSISSETSVESVILFTRYPVNELKDKKIFLTNKGATTPVLLQILCRLHYGFTPSLEVFADSIEKMTPSVDAVLLIGDEALSEKERMEAGGFQAIDLAKVWREWTGLPLVFAVWVARREYFNEEPEQVIEIYRALIASKEWGLRHLEEIKAHAKMLTKLSDATLRSYFSCLSYDLSQDLKKGMKLYFEYAKQCGFLESIGNFQDILHQKPNLRISVPIS